jgi:hypothetical protein
MLIWLYSQKGGKSESLLEIGSELISVVPKEVSGEPVTVSGGLRNARLEMLRSPMAAAIELAAKATKKNLFQCIVNA